MSKGRQKIVFHGLLEKNVLGTFTIIRGFADLRDLAAISKAMPYEASGLGQGTGYQRQLDEQHVGDIKRFIDKGSNRFFPEIVLSLRSTGHSDPIAAYGKRWVSHNDSTYKVTIHLKALAQDGYTRIRRIDGNHRLEAAKQLLEDGKRSAEFKGFSKAPFCFVVLDSDKPEDDELAEAMLFNLINSKAMRITSEHSLSILMKDDRASNVRFREDPQLYLTRLMLDRVGQWPQGFYTAMGTSPLSSLHAAAAAMLRPGGLASTDVDAMEKDAKSLFDPLLELATLLRESHEKFVHSYAFLPVAAEVYTHFSKVDPAKGANSQEERTRRAAKWLREFAQWFDRVDAGNLPVPADPCILWNVFKRDYDKRAGQVFVAMSFRESTTLDGVHKAIKEAITLFNAAHPDSPLSPVRVDEQPGASYELPSRIFHEIEQSRLVIADLTDERQNVYCEVGYAKARGIPFFLTFHKNGTDAANKVHADLAPYRYIEYDTTHDLRDKLQKELAAWHDQA